MDFCRNMVLSALLILMTECLSVSSQKRDCMPQQWQACVKSLTNITQQTRILFPPLSLDNYKKMCIDYQTNEHCLEPLIQFCNVDNRMVVDNEVNLLEFLCHSGEDDYAQFGPECFGRPLLKASITSCSAEFYDKRARLALKETITEQEKTEFCSLSQDVFSCRYLVMVDHCGEIAARWQHKAFTASMSYTLKSFECSYTLDHDFEVVRISVGIVFGIFIALILVIAFPVRVLVCPNNKIFVSFTKNKRKPLAEEA